jgi:DNA modification methylase
MKPVALLNRALAYSTRPGQVVVDPFLGSGPTLIAAQIMGRRCFGLEIEPRYVDVVLRRWEDFTGQGPELAA